MKLIEILKNNYRGLKRFDIGLQETKLILCQENIFNNIYIDYIEKSPKKIADLFAFDLNVIRASRLKKREINTSATQYLLQICKELGTKEYITAIVQNLIWKMNITYLKITILK